VSLPKTLEVRRCVGACELRSAVEQILWIDRQQLRAVVERSNLDQDLTRIFSLALRREHRRGDALQQRRR